MAFTLTKKPITFSVDQDELGWLDLKARRIGNRRSQVVQDMIRRDAEQSEGADWRTVVRAFVADDESAETSAA